MDAERSRRQAPSWTFDRTAKFRILGGKRRRLTRFALLSALWLLIPQLAAAQASSRTIALELYVRGDEHAALRDALTKAVGDRNGISLRVFDVAAEGEGQKRHEQICKHFKQAAAEAVPSMYACSQLIMAPTDADQLTRKLDELRTMKVFVRSGCSRCARTKEWLKTIEGKYPGFRLVYRDVVTDPSAQKEMNEVARRYNKSAVSVPLFHVCDQVQVGFDSPESSGRRLLAVLDKWTFEKKKPVEKTSSRPQTAAARQFAQQRAAAARFLPLTSTRNWSGVAAAIPLPALLLGQVAPEPDADEAELKPEELNDESLVASAGDADNGGFELPLPADVEAESLPLPGEISESVSDADAPAADGFQAPFIGNVRASRLGLPAFTVVIGLVDGFNPCAMWVLLFLLSILVNLQNRWKILAVAGSFVLVSGLAYFAFMAAWLNVMEWFGPHERTVQYVLGTFALIIGAVHVKDFFAFKKGVSFSIPDSAKSGIAARVRSIVMAESMFGAILGAVTLAVLINVIELLCTAGLPALYTDILQNQNVTGASKYGYLGLYNLAYMFDDALMVAIVVYTLDKTRLQEKQGRWLKLVSGAFVLALGVIMIFKPSLLQFV